MNALTSSLKKHSLKSSQERRNAERKLTHLGAEFDLIEETFLGVGVYRDKVTTHADNR